MSNKKNKKVLIMALVYENVVDAHLLEVHHVIRARLDGVFHFL